MNDLEQRIVEHLARPKSEPLTAADLARKLHIKKKELTEFRTAIGTLIDSGRVSRNKRGLLRPRSAPGCVVGILKKISSGAGFVIPHEPIREGDIYVAPRDLRDAHTG
ncbi:MAG: hypothetical protein ACREJB_08130, partial [Planctomycetaceae bacterium]